VTSIDMTITVKAGAVSINLASNPDDVLHHISASEFINKVLALANYVGPVDDPPVLPVDQPPVIWRTGDVARLAGVQHPPYPHLHTISEADDDDDASRSPMGKGWDEPTLFEHAEAPARPAPGPEDSVAQTPQAETRIKRVGSKDPYVQKILEDRT
jgi:hypothetical protein